MKAFIKEILGDTVVLSLLIILPLAFLGPGWRTTSQYQNGFRRDHKPVSGEAQEGKYEDRERDIPILRAFETEREARQSRDSRDAG